MKCFKLIVFIISLIVLTGCEATYELNIDNDFTENIIITPNNDDERIKLQNQKYNETAFYDPDDFCEEGDKVPGVEYYSAFYQNGLQFKYKFSEKYNESFAAKTNFPSFRYEALEESLIITSDDIRTFINYPELTKLTIKFITDKNVLVHNADRVDGNTYIWELQKGGETKSIYFKYEDPAYKGKKKNPNSNGNKKQNNQNNTNSETKNKKSHKILLIFLCLFLSFLIIFGIISFGNKNKNN